MTNNKWFVPEPEHYTRDFFLAIHIPGMLLQEPALELDGFCFRELSFAEWHSLERSDLAEKLMAEFEEKSHVFAVVHSLNLGISDSKVDDLVASHVLRLSSLISAFRLAQSGTVYSPEASMLYVQNRSLRVRHPGIYGRTLIEYDAKNRYVLNKSLVPSIDSILNDLRKTKEDPDPTIELALRFYERSYGFSLELPERLSFLFTALEATFGEYRKSNRPNPKVTLGAAASICEINDSDAVKDFIDAPEKGRKLRNELAHGSTSSLPEFAEDAEILLKEIVRKGLCTLLRFVREKDSLALQLEALSKGMSSEPSKYAFQRVLSFAAKKVPGAQNIIDRITVG